MSLNSTVLTGRLVFDPELRYIPSGTAICRARLASDRNWANAKGEKMTDTLFIDLDIWGKFGEMFAQFKQKGDFVVVQGYLKQESWVDKLTQQKRSKILMVVEHCDFGPLVQRKPKEVKPVDAQDKQLQAQVPVAMPVIQKEKTEQEVMEERKAMGLPTHGTDMDIPF